MVSRAKRKGSKVRKVASGRVASSRSKVQSQAKIRVQPPGPGAMTVSSTPSASEPRG